MQKLPEGAVLRIELRGTPMATAPHIQKLIEQKTGVPVDREAIRRSIRRLYETRLFETISVLAEAPSEASAPGSIVLVFQTEPRYFCGQLSIDGLSKEGPRLTEMISTANLPLGLPYSRQRLEETLERMHRLMEENGFPRAQISYQELPDPGTQQMNVAFHVVPGELAHVGRITLTGGTPALTLEEIEDISHIRPGDKVERNQVQNMLRRLRKHFQQGRRLEAQVAIARTYNASDNTVDYAIEVRLGPVVDITVAGAKISGGRIKKYVPVYQEGSVDEDLLKEGVRNLREYMQTEGYYGAKVQFEQKRSDDQVSVLYTVEGGPRQRLGHIRMEGNRYFDEHTLREHMSSQVAGWVLPQGRFSQSILNADVESIKALYLNNGFMNVQVTGSVVENYGGDAQKLEALFHIEEGPQILVGTLTIVGNKTFDEETLRRDLYTIPRQPYAESNVATDRDTLISFYGNQGFPRVQFEAKAKADEADPKRMNVTYTITEGERIQVQNVLVSGLQHTRRSLVARQFAIQEGDPLDQSRMVLTRTRLYDLGLFNEVRMAVQNPVGRTEQKNVLYQLSEARRTTFHFGGGIEFATGSSPGSNPQGNTGVSPTGSFNMTRINLFGRDQSLTFKSQLGFLIKRAQLIWEQPHWLDLPNLRLTASFLYDNTRDVNTFTAERLGGSLQVQQRLTRVDRLLYGYNYRRDKVDPSSFPAGFSPDLASLYAAPVRIGMPTFTYVRDSRDNPIDSKKGALTSADFGVATGYLGSQADFGRILAQNTTYHRIGKHYILARSTRIGVESPYGSSKVVPLPEHFFAGGGGSLRGFSLNQAGPRDLLSGFPVGGNAMLQNNVELRTPPLALPVLGQGLSLVFFHDMGNVFDTVSHMWSSAVHWSQPDQQACRSQTANCNFNYISQAVGSGLRYQTPIGPVRLDFGYNLNPPYFAAQNSGSSSTRVDRVRHFNVFFSIGQTF